MLLDVRRQASMPQKARNGVVQLSPGVTTSVLPPPNLLLSSLPRWFMVGLSHHSPHGACPLPVRGEETRRAMPRMSARVPALRVAPAPRVRSSAPPEHRGARAEWQSAGAVKSPSGRAPEWWDTAVLKQQGIRAARCRSSKTLERWGTGAAEHQSAGAVERQRAWSAIAPELRSAGASERLNSSVPVQQSARATERCSNGAAGRRGTGVSKPRCGPCKSFTTDHLLRITFLQIVRDRSFADGSAAASSPAGS